MKLFLFAVVASTMILSCNSKKQNAATETQTTSTTVDRAKDSAAIRNVIISFYNWYNTNYTKLMKYDLYSGIKKEDAPPYKINWNEVGRYQQFIRDSIPQLGAAFLAEQKLFFQRADSAFKKDVEDDIPYGFDYDWYTNSQEDTQYTLELINRNEPWNMMIDPEKAQVEIGVTQEEGSTGLIIQLKKENDKWTISKIGGI